MKTLIVSVRFLVLMTVVTGIVYPLVMTGAGNILFPGNVSGSMTEINGKPAGSLLIGQNFDSVIYFKPRPSAVNYNPLPSGGSNLGPTSSLLKIISDSLRASYIEYNKLDRNTEVPPDALYSSGSGLDPHISLENALLQCGRISAARNYDAEMKRKLNELVYKSLENPQFGFLGEPVINVLKLNIELDKL